MNSRYGQGQERPAAVIASEKTLWHNMLLEQARSQLFGHLSNSITATILTRLQSPVESREE